MADLSSIGTDGKQGTRLTLDELIWFELRGKNIAMARYDSILWKIRSGYLVVLYGALTLMLAGTDELKPNNLPALLLLVWGFGGLSWIVDLAFRFRQLLVVDSLNALMMTAIQRTGESASSDLTTRLLIAGEGSTPVSVDRKTGLVGVLGRSLFPGILIYIGTPLIVTISYLYHLKL